MARMYPSELCPYCGEVVAYPEYNNIKEGVICDAFSGMKYTNHECEGVIKNREYLQKAYKEAMDKLNNLNQ